MRNSEEAWGTVAENIGVEVRRTQYDGFITDITSMVERGIVPQNRIHELAETYLVQTIEREKLFFTSVWKLVEGLAREANSVVQLFDIDETIGKRRYRDDVDYTDIRFSAVPLMEQLGQDLAYRIKFGLLTTRPRHQVEPQLKDPQHLAALSPYLDPNFIFCTKYRDDERGFGSDLSAEQRFRIAKRFSAIIDPEKTVNSSLGRGHWRKVAIVYRQWRTQPDTAFGIVDDSSIIYLFRKDAPRLRGLFVNLDMMCD